MTIEADPSVQEPPVKDRRLPIPPGVHLAEAARGGAFADIKIRCRRQTADEAPWFARRRFAWNAGEVSGSLGDLGTFLPHIVGAITVVGMDPTGILTTFGLFYAFAGAFYGIPMAVQPMKAASAAVLIEPMDPAAIAGAGMVIGALFLILGATGVVSRIARMLPKTIAAGLQLGLGLSLAGLGVRLMESDFALALCIGIGMIALMRFKRVPVALLAILVGIAVGQVFGLAPPMPALDFGLHLPHLVIPTWQQVWHGTIYAVVPQVPLTLTNAIIVTAAVSRQLFPKELHPVNERNLALTTGIGNLLAAPFGGYMMCHGAGGMAGHVRFGARTATAPVLIGLIFLVLGVGFGSSGYALLRTIPNAVLGCLLFFSGIELALSAKPQEYRDTDLFLVLLMAAVGVALNPAAAFVVGWPLAIAFKRGWLSLHWN
ncbi:MAG TPA: putative sulfate/molybdate transporter [Stellaceae bacterium]|nr:putative sulfate/molybdate transporter [Stellaceae bacterium]